MWELGTLSTIGCGVWELGTLSTIGCGVWELGTLSTIGCGVWELGTLSTIGCGVWELGTLSTIGCGIWELGIGNIVFPSLREAERRAKTIMTSPSLPPDVAAQKLLPTISSNQVSRQQRQAGSGHLPAISHQPSRQHRAPGQLHRNKNKHIKNQVRAYVPCALVLVVVILGDLVCSNTTSILAVAMS